MGGLGGGGGRGGSITAEPTQVETPRRNARDEINTLRSAKRVPREARLHDLKKKSHAAGQKWDVTV